MIKRLHAALLALLIIFLLAACGKAKPETTPEPTPALTPAPTSAPTPEPTPDNSAAVAAGASAIEQLMDNGRYYEAFRELVALEEKYSGDAASVSVCEALFDKLDVLLRELEPESGTELSRSFSVQGGGELEISAFSGPVLVTVIDEYAVLEGNPEPPSVCFYVRQGEIARTNLPAGTYRVSYQVGYRWFGEADRFGEYCTEGQLAEPLVFEFYMNGQWASTSKFKITL